MDYEVLSPWAEVDPLKLRGLAPRLTDLNGKAIGLFANVKPAGKPVARQIEQQLKERFPKAKFIHYYSPLHRVEAIKDDRYKTSFKEWVESVDAVITAYGD